MKLGLKDLKIIISHTSSPGYINARRMTSHYGNLVPVNFSVQHLKRKFLNFMSLDIDKFLISGI